MRGDDATLRRGEIFVQDGSNEIRDTKKTTSIGGRSDMNNKMIVKEGN
ncbi:MAG: hypothetical protein OEL89_01185 [Candidatus Peregrinibacteria bacterium]|nr:hypothetical protein [Candidatus Peregrinibacteria bacterium]